LEERKNSNVNEFQVILHYRLNLFKNIFLEWINSHSPTPSLHCDHVHGSFWKTVIKIHRGSIVCYLV
jgi:hypothetical protein